MFKQDKYFRDKDVYNGDLEARSISGDGEIVINGIVKALNVDISGNLSIHGNINAYNHLVADELFVDGEVSSGVIKCKQINCVKLFSDIRVEAEKVKAAIIKVHDIRATTINCYSFSATGEAKFDTLMTNFYFNFAFDVIDTEKIITEIIRFTSSEYLERKFWINQLRYSNVPRDIKCRLITYIENEHICYDHFKEMALTYHNEIMKSNLPAPVKQAIELIEKF